MQPATPFNCWPVNLAVQLDTSHPPLLFGLLPKSLANGPMARLDKCGSQPHSRVVFPTSPATHASSPRSRHAHPSPQSSNATPTPPQKTRNHSNIDKMQIESVVVLIPFLETMSLTSISSSCCLAVSSHCPSSTALEQRLSPRVARQRPPNRRQHCPMQSLGRSHEAPVIDQVPPHREIGLGPPYV